MPVKGQCGIADHSRVIPWLLCHQKNRLEEQVQWHVRRKCAQSSVGSWCCWLFVTFIQDFIEIHAQSKVITVNVYVLSLLQEFRLGVLTPFRLTSYILIEQVMAIPPLFFKWNVSSGDRVCVVTWRDFFFSNESTALAIDRSISIDLLGTPVLDDSSVGCCNLVEPFTIKLTIHYAWVRSLENRTVLGAEHFTSPVEAVSKYIHCSLSSLEGGSLLWHPLFYN